MLGILFKCKDAHKILKALAEGGADVNARDPDGGRTALSQACEDRHVDLVKYLVETAGADPNVLGANNNPPLYHAVKDGYKKTNALKLAKYLVKHGAEVNKVDKKQKNTPLHAAAIAGDLEVVKFLVKSGADVNARGDKRTTPLLNACINRNIDVVRFLITEGADINAEGGEKKSNPVYAAVSKGNIGIVTLLVEAGAKLNTPSYNGMTPLALANSKGATAIVKLLEEAGAEEGPPPKIIRRSKKGDPKGSKRCGLCDRLIKPEVAKHNYCKECKAHYCSTHFPWGPWESIHIVTDTRVRSVRCPYGHKTEEDDDYMWR